MSQTKNQHPCLTCGACCASFRVAFYWREAEADGIWKTPKSMTEELDQWLRCMKGTTSKHQPKCDALTGRIGNSVSCQIYANRPSPCRNFQASFENNVHNPRCDQARAKHGLRPLGREDFNGLSKGPSDKPLVEK